MNRSRRVKIVATLGPASNTTSKIRELTLAGADVFRINMSHASHDLMRATVKSIREVEKELDFPIGVMVDLQGPKHRLGVFENGEIDVAPGDTITLDSDPTPGNSQRIHLSRRYNHIHHPVQPERAGIAFRDADGC